MAGWRQAFELALSDEDVARFVVRHGFETPGCACSGGQG